MSKKIVLFFAVVIFACGFKFVNAEVIISEVMYAPDSGSDHEWIEIYNNGSESINLKDWRLFYDTNSNNVFDSSPDESHPLTLRQGPDSILEQSEYAIIAKSPTYAGDYIWLNFQGKVFSATMSLSDEGKMIGLTDSGKILKTSLTYDTSLGGSKETKTSLSLINGEWKSGKPTPGAENEVAPIIEKVADVVDTVAEVVDDTADTTTTTVSHSSGSSSSSKPKIKTIPVFKADILAPTLAFVGQPIEFNLSIKYGDESYAIGKYFWNFGDGVSMDKNDGFVKFNHTYLYPGEYNVSLEYFRSNGSFAPDITDSITIKVVPLTVSISNVGDAKDFFVELSNTADYKIDISKWVLSSRNKTFSIPKNTNILAKKSLIISGKISGFNLEDEASLKLSMPTGDVVFDYNTKSVPVKKLIPKVDEVNTDTNVGVNKNTDINTSIDKNNSNNISDVVEEKTILDSGIPSKDLAGAPILSDSVSGSSSTREYMFFTGLVSMLVGAGVAVYFIRRKKKIIPTGEDFDILDE